MIIPSVMRKYLESKIKERQNRLLEIEKERQTNLAEKRAYEDTLQHLIADEKCADGGTAPQGGFEKSPEWQNIMTRLRERGRSFSANDLVNIGHEFGYKTKIPNSRSQIAFYMKKGYVRRIRRGLYSITDKGQGAFNVEEPSDKLEGSSNLTGEASSLA